MKKGTIIAIAIGVVVLLLAIALVSGYNSLVTMETNVDAAFADIDVYLQRRADLVPNLVNTVKGFMEHEQAVIDSVTSARAKLAGATTTEDKIAADQELTGALSRLMVVVENYPELKSSENFTQLADELAGTENRIAVARKDYNEAVKAYNTAIRKFPNNLLAGMFGFSAKTLYEASESAQNVPNVEF